MNSSVKQIANAPKPRIAYINSLKVLGTSSDTTSNVMANPKTASLRPSVREISWLRQRNFLLSPIPRSISFSLIISLPAAPLSWEDSPERLSVRRWSGLLRMAQHFSAGKQVVHELGARETGD